MNEKQLLLRTIENFLEGEYILEHTLCSFNFEKSSLRQNLLLVTNKSLIYTACYEYEVLTKRINYNEILRVYNESSSTYGELIITTKTNTYTFKSINKDNLNLIKEKLNDKINKDTNTIDSLSFEKHIDNLDYINQYATTNEIELLKENINSVKPKKKLNKIVIALIIVLGFVILGSCSNTTDITEESDISTETEIDTQISTKVEEGITIEEVDTDITRDELLNDVLTILESNLGSSISNVEGNLTQNGDDYLYTIKVTPYSGMSQDAVSSYTLEGSATWDKLVDNFANMSSSGKEYLETNGYNNVNISIFLVNDLDTSKALISVLDGVVLYDVSSDWDEILSNYIE